MAKQEITEEILLQEEKNREELLYRRESQNSS